jgi:hypothetical protein
MIHVLAAKQPSATRPDRPPRHPASAEQHRRRDWFAVIVGFAVRQALGAIDQRRPRHAGENQAAGVIAAVAVLLEPAEIAQGVGVGDREVSHRNHRLVSPVSTRHGLGFPLFWPPESTLDSRFLAKDFCGL